MIFVHGPAGFIFSSFFKKFFKEKKFFWLTFFFAIFPDFDVFYHYFFDASTSHRENITHTFFLYAIICLLVLFIFRHWALAIFLGVVSHLLLDSIGYGVMWLWPFSTEMYGLTKIFFLKSFVDENYFLVNFFIEFSILVSFLFIFFRTYNFRSKLLHLLWFLIPIFFACLVFANSHLFYGSGGLVSYGDYDGDGIANKDDLDIDGDGILNIKDQDADGDKIDNFTEIKSLTKHYNKVWYDYSEGGMFEVPLRLGLLNNINAVRKVFEAVGVYFRAEFANDYKNNSVDYVNNINNSRFELEVANLVAFAKHKNLFVSDYKLGDIVIFNNNDLAIITNLEGDDAYVSGIFKDFHGERKLIGVPKYIIRMFN